MSRSYKRLPLPTDPPPSAKPPKKDQLTTTLHVFITIMLRPLKINYVISVFPPDILVTEKIKIPKTERTSATSAIQTSVLPSVKV